MTIDEAIKCADAISKDTYEIGKLTPAGVQEFAALCADALRLAKKMSEENGLCEPEPNADTWQERMKREYRETKERAEKLYCMIVKHEAGTLDFTPNCPIKLLKRQYGHMSDYLFTLEVRAESEGVKL